MTVTRGFSEDDTGRAPGTRRADGASTTAPAQTGVVDVVAGTGALRAAGGLDEGATDAASGLRPSCVTHRGRGGGGRRVGPSYWGLETSRRWERQGRACSSFRRKNLWSVKSVSLSTTTTNSWMTPGGTGRDRGGVGGEE